MGKGEGIMPNNKTITPVGIWSQHGAFLTVTDLTEILKIAPVPDYSSDIGAFCVL